AVEDQVQAVVQREVAVYSVNTRVQKHRREQAVELPVQHHIRLMIRAEEEKLFVQRWRKRPDDEDANVDRQYRIGDVWTHRRNVQRYRMPLLLRWCFVGIGWLRLLFQRMRAWFLRRGIIEHEALLSYNWVNCVLEVDYASLRLSLQFVQTKGFDIL